MSLTSDIQNTLQVSLPTSAKKAKLHTNYRLCILCQDKKKSPLVNPVNYDKVLQCVKKRAEWNENEYMLINNRLGNVTVEELKSQNASWHSQCYKRCTHKANIERSNRFYEERKSSSSISTNDESHLSYTTRSKISMNDRNKCFFCVEKGKRRNPLIAITTYSAGLKLKKAVDISENEAFKIRLSDCTDPGDPHAKDIVYHKQCWAKYVTNVLRKKDTPNYYTNSQCVSNEATDIEFISSIKEFLYEGNVTTIAELEKHYQAIAAINEGQTKPRKEIKSLIEEEVENVVFHKPRRVNEPQRVSLKATVDATVADAEEAFEDIGNNMKTLFEAASVLRKAILSSKKWSFTGSLQKDQIENVVPAEVNLFFKWCCYGKANMKYAHQKSKFTVIDKAERLSQILMYEILSPHQASNNENVKSVRHVRDMPLQVAVGLTMHSTTRSKFIIQFLHGIGVSIDYAKILRIETQIANEVIKNMDDSGGFYIPRDLVKGRFIFCAADNIDFLEDTPYGKGTLHGTVMAVYQQEIESDNQVSISFTSRPSCRSLHTIPQSISEITNCNIPKSAKPTNPTSGLITEDKNWGNEILNSFHLQDIVWMMARVRAIDNPNDDDNLLETDYNVNANENTIVKDTVINIPNWSAYNSLINESGKKTRVCVLPLINNSSNCTSTQLTFMQKLENVTKFIVGTESRTVVSLDIGLFKPVLKLSMVKKELSKNWVLRPGELHTVMAMLRAIGSFLDGTGLESTLTELYNENVVSKILAGKCVRRAIEAHTTLRLALFKCYIDVFFSHNADVKSICENEIEKLASSFQRSDTEAIRELHSNVVKIFSNIKILDKMKDFETKESHIKPTFKVALEYMHMVDTMLLFIRSVRSSDWELHIASLEAFVHYFFALDMSNYASMITWYLADMKRLKVNDSDLWNHFVNGNWVVNKSTIPFCALGSDEALEHENRRMKVVGGLVNITQKKNALTRFFFTSPELARLATETKKIVGLTDEVKTKHHYLAQSVGKRQHEDIQCIYNAIRASTNPITYQGSELINTSTKFVFNKTIQTDTLQISEKGREMYTIFKTERIETDTINFWAPMKKGKLNLCNSARKTVATKISDTVVQLKADRSLFTRLLIVSRSRADIDLKQSLSKYEFSAVPQSLFNLDGTMKFTANKAKLMNILEQESKETVPQTPQNTCDESKHLIVPPHCVAVVDGMAELQSLKKPAHVKTCNDLAVEFNNKISQILLAYDETHLVFDTYAENSLKSAMRIKRAGNVAPVEYKITDSTNISNIQMKTLLSHSKTKDKLTAYLSEKSLLYARKIERKLIVSWRMEAKCSSESDIIELKSSHEEADTKIILHCLYASQRGATTIHIYSPDTDVFLLALWWSQSFRCQSMFITGAGNNRRTIDINQVHYKIGPERVRGILALHALSGSDITGSLTKKGKPSFWKVYKTAENDELNALGKLGCREEFGDEDILAIEKFICKVYVPGTKISDIGELRWWMFSKHETQSENLPPTRASLQPFILRSHYQVMEWRLADHQHPDLPSPSDFGWEIRNNAYFPVMCTLQCAPQSILNLIRCSCVKGKCILSCKCKTQNILCTELCVCGGDTDLCENHNQKLNIDDYTDDEDVEF